MSVMFLGHVYSCGQIKEGDYASRKRKYRRDKKSD